MRRPAAELRAAVFALVAALGIPGAAIAADGTLSVRAGVERVSGDYGGPQSLEDTSIPVTLLYERPRMAVRVLVPYLEIALVDAVDSSIYNETGLGDVVVSVTGFDVYRSSRGTVAVDLTGKLKLGTADELRGLGTGETDYSAQADIYRLFERTAFVTSVGYRVRGEPTGVEFEDTWLLSLGAMRRFTTATSGALFLDYRESAIAGSTAIREITASITRRLRSPWRLTAYVIRGLSDPSLDWGSGFSVRRDF